MAQPTPLMPHATASWLVDNTALSFEQIAEFCGLHILEVQAMADDLASSKYTGRDPVHSGELNHDEIEKGQADPNYRLKMQRAPVDVSRTKGPRYTPVSKRQDKPDGIAWIIRNHPEISDAQIGKLIGTTRNTINAIRDRSHWNIQQHRSRRIRSRSACARSASSTRRWREAAKRAGAERRGRRDRRREPRRSREPDRRAARRARGGGQGRGRGRPGSRGRSLARSQARARKRPATAE